MICDKFIFYLYYIQYTIRTKKEFILILIDAFIFSYSNLYYSLQCAIEIKLVEVEKI